MPSSLAHALVSLCAALQAITTAVKHAGRTADGLVKIDDVEVKSMLVAWASPTSDVSMCCHSTSLPCLGSGCYCGTRRCLRISIVSPLSLLRQLPADQLQPIFDLSSGNHKPQVADVRLTKALSSFAAVVLFTFSI